MEMRCLKNLNFEFLFIDPIKSLCKSNKCIQYQDKKFFI